MLKPIYKLCSACGGTKVVSYIPHAKPEDYTKIKGGTEIPCSACGGNGYVPTGDFILSEPSLDILHEVGKLEDARAKLAIHQRI